MGLVDYGSDSDDSDAGKPQTAQTTPAAAAKSTSSTFAKGIDRSASGKIRVSLPETKPEPSTGGLNAGQPPAKRAKTIGIFSGLSSRLPPPKNAAKPVLEERSITEAQDGTRPRGNGLQKGINLKTGAAPAFSRDIISAQSLSPAGAVLNKPRYFQAADGDQDAAQAHGAQDEVKLVGKATVFRPLSVSKKTQIKKAKKASVNVSQSPTAQSDASPIARPPAAADAPVKKPQVSLFGSSMAETAYSSAPVPNGQYKPLLEDEDGASWETDEKGSAAPMQQQALKPQTNDLKSVADQLNLTPSERRRLFGRKDNPDAARVRQFNLSSEYQHNNEFRESQAAAPQQNPVRSIAPGKHSLQQLLNAATSQQDALEDSFAQGRRNKQEAGSRYGW